MSIQTDMTLKLTVQHLRGWGGINNRDAVTDIQPNQLTDGLNLDFSTPMRLDVRLGFSALNSATISGSGAIMSMHRFVGSADTSLLAFVNDGTVRKMQGAGGTFADSKSGLSTQSGTYGVMVQFGGRRVSTTNYAGRAFFVNGKDANQTYSEEDGWQNMGLEAPSTAPTLAVSGYAFTSAAMASGTYYFKTTFYNSNKGLESNPSQASTVLSLTASGGGITVTLPATADSQADYKRIYRTTPAGGIYNYLVQVAASATAYLATAADSVLGDAVEIDNNVPPKVKYLEEFQSCLFGAGDTTDSVSKSLLYFSKQLDDSPESWPSSYYLSITPDDGDVITLVRKIGDRLIVAKNNSWGIVVGYSPSTFRYVVMDNSHGCIAPRSVALSENAVIFLSNDGFRACNGNTAVLLCEKTMKFDQMNFNLSQLDKFYGAYFRYKRQYICGVVTGSNTQPDKSVKIQFPDQQWGFDDYSFRSIAQFFDTNQNERLYIGGASGTAYTMFPAGLYADAGAAIPWNFESGPIYGGTSPSLTKRWHTAVIDADQTSAPVYNFQYSVDGGNRSDAKSITHSTRQVRTGMNKIGNYTQLYMSGTGSTYTRIHDIELRANVEPPRKL